MRRYLIYCLSGPWIESHRYRTGGRIHSWVGCKLVGFELLCLLSTLHLSLSLTKEIHHILHSRISLLLLLLLLHHLKTGDISRRDHGVKLLHLLLQFALFFHVCSGYLLLYHVLLVLPLVHQGVAVLIHKILIRLGRIWYHLLLRICHFKDRWLVIWQRRHNRLSEEGVLVLLHNSLLDKVVVNLHLVVYLLQLLLVSALFLHKVNLNTLHIFSNTVATWIAIFFFSKLTRKQSLSGWTLFLIPLIRISVGRTAHL